MFTKIVPLTFVTLIFIFLISCTNTKKLENEFEQIKSEYNESQIKITNISCLSTSQLHEILNESSLSHYQSQSSLLGDEISYQNSISDAFPSVSVGINYGSTFRGFSSIRWNILKYLSMDEIGKLRVNNIKINELKLTWNKKQFASTLYKHYLQYQLSDKSIKILSDELSYLNQIQEFSLLLPDELTEIESQIYQLENKTVQFEKSLFTNKQKVESALGVKLITCESNVPIDSFKESSLPLGLYIQMVLENDELLKSRILEEEQLKVKLNLIKNKKWFNFNISTHISESLDPFALFSWTYDLIDNGAFERETLAVKLKSFNDAVDMDAYVGELIINAGNSWYEFYLVNKQFKWALRINDRLKLSNIMLNEKYITNKIKQNTYIKSRSNSLSNSLALLQKKTAKIGVTFDYQLLINHKGR